MGAAIFAGPRHLRRDLYEDLVGERFAVRTGGVDSISLRLLEVGDYGGGTRALRHVAGRPDAFTLLFRGPHTPRLESASHRLFHPRLGAFQLLLTPSGGQDYFAVVNRIRNTRVLRGAP
jgi:hypothetical protein